MCVFVCAGIELFVCGDQLLRGAALNAVLIAERVAAQHCRPRRTTRTGDDGMLTPARVGTIISATGSEGCVPGRFLCIFAQS